MRSRAGMHKDAIPATVIGSKEFSLEEGDCHIVDSPAQQNVGAPAEGTAEAVETSGVNHVLKHKAAPSRACAILGLFLAGLLHSVFSLLVKVSSKSFPVTQILCSRYSVQLLATSLLLRYRRLSPLGPPAWHTRASLLLRGVFGMTSQFCHTVALSLLPLPDAVSLHALYPVITALLAPFLLGEQLTAAAVVGAAAATAGCMLIAGGRVRGSAEDAKVMSLHGIAAAVAGALMASLTYMLVRKLVRAAGAHEDKGSERAHPLVVVWAYSAVSLSMIFSTLPLGASTFTFHASSHAWLTLLSVGLVSIMEQVLMTAAFKDVDARVGTVLLTMETAFAFLFGVTVLKEQVHAVTVLGAGFITGAVVFAALQQLKPDEVVRHRSNNMESVELAAHRESAADHVESGIAAIE